MKLEQDNFYLTRVGEVVQLTGYNSSGMLCISTVYGRKCSIYMYEENLLCPLHARMIGSKLCIGLYVTSSNFHMLEDRLTLVHRATGKEIDVKVVLRDYDADVNLYALFVVPLL